jgi:hypothetical protein
MMRMFRLFLFVFFLFRVLSLFYPFPSLTASAHPLLPPLFLKYAWVSVL